MIYKISGSITLMMALLVLGAWNFHTAVLHGTYLQRLCSGRMEGLE
jgi:hypothetical protein